MSESEEIERLKQWVSDLQSGMFINCVYCGHRYGPKDKTPATMADMLKLHVATCPAHPMSHLLKACKLAFHTLSSLRAVREGIPNEALDDYIKFIGAAIEQATATGRN